MQNYDHGRLSQAVLEHSLDLVSTAHHKVSETGRATADDVRLAAAGLALLFKHFEEVGLNRASQAAVRENRNEVLQYAPGDREIDGIRALLEGRGHSVSKAYLHRDLGNANRRGRGLLAITRAGGIKEFEDQLIEIANAFSDTLGKRAAMEPFGAGYVRVAYSPNDAASTICDALSFLAALWALGCALTWGLCVTCCIAAAILYVFEAFLELVGFCWE